MYIYAYTTYKYGDNIPLNEYTHLSGYFRKMHFTASY